MATENATANANGIYGAHPGYSMPEQSQLSSGSRAPEHPEAPSGYGNGSAGSEVSTAGKQEKKSDVSKDEVGWFFVEQYYTTLSKHPEKLHLFYGKRSQFLSGLEAEKVPVSLGQRAIGERIKAMEIQDCKVRVSNVDSQESYDNIVVQVIGEMSLKAAPHRKFTQTFVLAQQPNGYFVLNDIFRYLIEEDEEEYPEEAAAEPGLTPEQPAGAESTTVATSEDTAEQQHDATQVDEKLEEEVPAAPAAPAEENLPNGVSQTSDVAVAEDAPAAAVASQDIEAGRAEEPAAEASTATDDLQTEKPRDSDPTPIASPPKPTEATPPPSVPAQPPKPAAPRTWATLVASNSQSSTPNTSSPAPSASQQQAPSQPKSALSTQSTSSPTTSPSESRKPPQTNGNAGWQTQEGGKRQGRHQSMSGNMPGDRNTVLGYVKNVNEKVDASLLKQALSSFGELAYFDVSRQKNCAFIEFVEPKAYAAAVSQNPHNIGGELVFVEERRPRPNAFGGGYQNNNRGGSGAQRGGRGGNMGGNENGRQGSQGGRGGYKGEGGRGGFTPRGRGQGMRGGGQGQGQRGGGVAA